MFRVRSEQKNALAREETADFERRAVRHLRTFFGARCADVGDDLLAERVRAWTARAALHGIVTERGVVSFVDVALLSSDDFEQQPWAARILGDAAVDPERRAQRLLDAALDARDRG